MALANYAKACSKNTGGNSTFYIVESSKVASATVTAGEITALTLTTGSVFFTVDFDQDTLIRTQEGTGSGDKISYVHRIEAMFSQLTVALNTFRDSLADESACGLVAMVKDGNGTWWVVGYNETDLATRGLKMIQDNDTSGGAPADEDGGKASIILESNSGFLDLPVNGTVTTSGVA